MNTNSLMKHGKALRRVLALAVASGAALLPTIRASLRVLDFSVQYPTQSGRCVSGNGAVVLGTDSHGTGVYWTAAAGVTPIPKPAAGKNWLLPFYPNFDGSVIAGTGAMQGRFHASAWTWRKGIGIRNVQSSDDSYNMENLGLSLDGSFVVRTTPTQSGGVTVHRDSSTGQSAVWTTITNASLYGLSEDGSTLFGAITYPGTSARVPCYWKPSGGLVYGSEFLQSPDDCDPVRCSKDGSVVVGIATTSVFDPRVQQNVCKVFRWNTLTHQIDYYLPAEFIFTQTDFVSPKGDIFFMGGRTQSLEVKGGIVDLSTPTEAAKGLQDAGVWLVAHRYVSSTESKDRTFAIFSMSDDETVAVGTFRDKNGVERGFLAQKPFIGVIPTLGVNGGQ